MTRLHKTTRKRSHDLLHHENGAHRGTPPTAKGSDVDAYYNAIDAHLYAHERRAFECGSAFDHTPDRDIDPGPDCAICGKPRG